MISNSCDFGQFIEAIKETDSQDIIYLANQEATEAERGFYRKRVVKGVKKEDMIQYATRLKGLIFFVRYGVKPVGFGPKDLGLLRSVHRGMGQRSRWTSLRTAA
jgi:hypothetical protein